MDKLHREMYKKVVFEVCTVITCAKRLILPVWPVFAKIRMLIKCSAKDDGIQI